MHAVCNQMVADTVPDPRHVSLLSFDILHVGLSIKTFDEDP